MARHGLSCSGPFSGRWGRANQLEPADLGRAIDSNGNEITATETFQSNGYTCTDSDTLGRSWILTTGLSTTTGCPVAAIGTSTWSVPGPNGNSRTFTFCFSNLQLQVDLPPGSGYRNFGSPIVVMTGVILPDGTKWQFDYEGRSIAQQPRSLPNPHMF